MRHALHGLLLCLLLSACAGPVTMAPQGTRAEVIAEAQRQRQLVFQNYIADQRRLFDVSLPLMTANAGPCGKKTAPLPGMTAWNIHTVNKNYRDAAISLFALDDRPRVQFVAKNGAAQRAGIKTDDILIAINGQNIPTGPDAIAAASSELRRAGQKQSQILLERKGELIAVILTPEEGCDYPVLLDYDSGALNAHADGKRIVVTKGIVRFAARDDELAMVVAHELGHSAMGHIDKMKQNATVGMLGGVAIDGLLAAAGVNTGGQFSGLGGQMALLQYSIPFEQEADYVGMYFMARAGYSTAGVADFWRRMGAEGENAIRLRTTHPTSPERFLAIDRTAGEISDKKRKGLPLAPNLRLQ